MNNSARDRIRDVIVTYPGLTKHEIAELAGVRPTTVANEVGQLRSVERVPVICDPGYWTYRMARTLNEARPWLDWMRQHIETRTRTAFRVEDALNS